MLRLEKLHSLKENEAKEINQKYTLPIKVFTPIEKIKKEKESALF